MAYTPGAETLTLETVDPHGLADLLVGCTIKVQTEHAGIQVKAAAGTLVAVAAMPLNGGVSVIVSDKNVAGGTVKFAHNFVPVNGPEVYFPNVYCNNAATPGIWLIVHTDGDPAILYYK